MIKSKKLLTAKKVYQPSQSKQKWLANPETDPPEKRCRADTTTLEAEIDRLVYALYGLTEEEIQIVEESTQ